VPLTGDSDWFERTALWLLLPGQFLEETLGGNGSGADLMVLPIS
jgi:hypothetical protein